jgi:hypothetical protein
VVCLLPFDDRSDAIFDASLILELQRHGLTSYLPNRAAPAGAGEEDEDEQPATEDESSAFVVRQRSASKRQKRPPPVDLSEFEAALLLHVTNADNPKKCGAEKAGFKLRDLRLMVLYARDIKKSRRNDASPPVSARDLAALFNTERVMEHLETVSRDRAHQLLGTIICALIRNRDSPESVVADESVVAYGLRTCQDLIEYYLEHHRVAKHALSNSNEPSSAQTEGWVPWPVLAERGGGPGNPGYARYRGACA